MSFSVSITFDSRFAQKVIAGVAIVTIIMGVTNFFINDQKDKDQKDQKNLVATFKGIFGVGYGILLIIGVILKHEMLLQILFYTSIGVSGYHGFLYIYYLSADNYNDQQLARLWHVTSNLFLFISYIVCTFYIYMMRKIKTTSMMTVISPASSDASSSAQN